MEMIFNVIIGALAGFSIDRIWEWWKKRKAGLTGLAHSIISKLGNSIQSFNGTVQYLDSAVPPRGLGYKAGKYQAHRYRMTCNGYGPRDSQTSIEAGFFRIRFSL